MFVNRRVVGYWFLAIGIFAVAANAVTGIAAADEKESPPREPLALVATVVRGKEVSRLSVFLQNQTDRPISFNTGARGGRGSLDDRVPVLDGDRHVTLVIGTAPTVIPTFRFEVLTGEIALQPPRISGPTNRAMRPHITTIPVKGRIPYASFAVPSSLIAGKFIECEMTIRGEKDAPEPDIVGRWEMRLVTKELREEAAQEEGER
jgi:hypothetical protein